MTQLTMVMGTLLVVVGIGGYLMTGMASPTALIPAVLGALLVGIAIWGRAEASRKHAMHGAMLVALLGIAGTARGLMQLSTLLSGGEVARPAAVYSQSITALLLIVLLVAGVRSFVAARQAR